jgi:hypothetical protein
MRYNEDMKRSGFTLIEPLDSGAQRHGPLLPDSMMMKRILSLIALIPLTLPSFAFAADGVILDIEFPVDGEVRFHDDYGEPRSGGRIHGGVDLIGEKMMPLLAAVDGHISYLTETEPSWGWSLTIRDASGYEFTYIHLNNDTPGTDDGEGGYFNAFASNIYRGARVTRGQVVGYMGDSGNAEETSPHLHFEIHKPEGGTINPYLSLVNASRSKAYDPEAERALAISINTDKDLQPTFAARYCLSGTLITSPATDAVYYCGEDAKRYGFPNAATYFTWYDDFSTVQTISPEELAAITLGGTVTYHPGVKLVKIVSDPKVYAVARGGVLRHVASESVATSLYGAGWAKLVEDIPDAFFAAYTYGEPITYTP